MISRAVHSYSILRILRQHFKIIKISCRLVVTVASIQIYLIFVELLNVTRVAILAHMCVKEGTLAERQRPANVLLTGTFRSTT